MVWKVKSTLGVMKGGISLLMLRTEKNIGHIVGWDV